MHSLRRRLFVVLSPLVFLPLFLAACGGPTTPEQTVTPTIGATPTAVAMPPTETGCPAAGTARRAVLASLVLGRHATVVYVENQGDRTHPIAGMLKRYDITNGGVPITFVTSTDATGTVAMVGWTTF